MEFSDPFDKFLHFYERGLIEEALQVILPDALVTYDSLHSSEKSFPYFVNFIDASVFKGAMEFNQTFLVLESFCQESPALKIITQAFLEAIRLEFVLFSGFIHSSENMDELEMPASLKDFFILYHSGGVEAHQNALEKSLEKLPLDCQDVLRKKLVLKHGWERLQKEKSALTKYLEGTDWRVKQPWHSYAYPISIEHGPILAENEFPIIFIEPVRNLNYAAFLRPYCEKECLFIFHTIQHLFQLLHFPDLHEIFALAHVHLYVMELYPQEQLFSQNLYFRSPSKFKLIWMTAYPYLIEAMPAFEDALQACLQQNEVEIKGDTPQANWLYEIAKRTLQDIESNRYGKERAIAFSIEKGFQRWNDLHKGSPPAHANLGPAPKMPLDAQIKALLNERKPRLFQPNNKIRLAHIVTQIVDGGHAPTKLLKTLCTLADRQWFEVCVISNERIAEHLLSYPIATYVSPSSQVRGYITIKYLNHFGILVVVDAGSPTYEMAIKEILGKLTEFQIDIAVFHGPDELNSIISGSTDVPIRVLFDHGTLPSYPCFDLAILSTDEAYNQNHQAFQQAGMESCVLNFSLDVRPEWEKEPFSRESIGLPESSFVMTTISNHLDSRLTSEMCHAIAIILQRCPQAVYAPIGEVTKKEGWFAIFNQYEVAERVYFLGNLPVPSQYARSMHLYLNEFPFGSGLSILDAMAAGCPVVSMYDENGPQQARYGATYFGIDRVIKTGKVEDYIELACRLIEDPALYKKWSEHALEQYEKRVDTKGYVKKFETILEQYIAFHLKNSC
ncbi:MAG: glycosyltransferase [Candidatus Protochlamydia sp.]|nr:glycosyltransferase [Candidatus Protochlamydia sp.]